MKPTFVLLTVKLQVGSRTEANPCLFNVNKIECVVVGPNGENRLFLADYDQVQEEYFVLLESPTEAYAKIWEVISHEIQVNTY